MISTAAVAGSKGPKLVDMSLCLAAHYKDPKASVCMLTLRHRCANLEPSVMKCTTRFSKRAGPGHGSTGRFSFGGAR